ncbi:hypothetical protein IE077_000512 [Cardiosporidium cionae]|uniref:IST1 homolog n=1 Tax=Cardiosporidium cionae TaxID=476202 RepID=A0ABQ7J8Q3_9APIC|nr:hypothetical protein IE077_000512 [Cardiosporidium cionae]|eukprot:KAF8820351.1 hypothetical protein IE077_000512 [Cardiosporidium cionae]
MGPFNKFNAANCRTKLHLACNRAKINKNKLNASSKYLRIEIAGLLKIGKDEVASIKTERLLHDRNLEKAYEELQTFCEILAERISIIDSSKYCPSDLIAVVDSILYCEPRTKILELSQIKDELKKKYGKGWVKDALQNKRQQVHYKLIQYLSLVPPLEVEIVQALASCAKENGTHWIPPNYASRMPFNAATIHGNDLKAEPPVMATCIPPGSLNCSSTAPYSQEPSPTAPPPPQSYMKMPDDPSTPNSTKTTSHDSLYENPSIFPDPKDASLDDRISRLGGKFNF